MVEKLVQFNTKMLFDSALEGCGQCRLYSPHPQVVLVSCPLCEARGKEMHFEVKDGSFEAMQDHVNLHYQCDQVSIAHCFHLFDSSQF